MKIKLCWILICIIIFFSCTDNRTSTNCDDCAKSYDLNLSIQNSISIEDFLDSVRTTRIEVKDPILLKSFSGHILKQLNNLYLLKPNSEHRIYAINKIDGNHVWTLSFEENQPNFPQYLFDFAINQESNEIFIWDYYKKVFYIYNIKGQFLRSIIPKELPNKSYFDYYNSKDNGIIFHVQGVPDYNDKYSSEYVNEIFSFYSYEANSFSSLMSIDQGSPMRNSFINRDFFMLQSNLLLYYYHFGNKVYAITKDEITPYLEFYGDLFINTNDIHKIDIMDRINSNVKDLEFVNDLARSKITFVFSIIEMNNYLLLIANAGPELYYFLLSKDNNSYIFNKSEFNGFSVLNNYGCYKKRPLFQNLDGSVVSVTDGVFLNDSGLECETFNIVNHPLGATINNEDIFITEYFFKESISFPNAN